MKNNKNTDITGVSSQNMRWAGIVALGVVLGATPLFAGAAMLTRQLEMGMRGTDVSTLQSYLAQDTSVYPQGLVTGYFGFLTKAAVSNFQSKNGIESVGRVGPKTLAVINSRLGGGSTGSTDVWAPLLLSANATPSRTSATVSWSTNESARSKVYYSTSPIRLNNTYEQTGIDFVEPTVSGSLASYDGVARTSHSVTINDLQPNTTYYYVVLALDSANNASITLPASFRTAM